MFKWRKKLSRNAKWLLLTEPGWSIPMPWIFYYQSIYVTALGISELEYGAYMSLSRGLAMVAPLMAMPVAAKLSLKKAFLVLDTLANAGVLLPFVTGRRELVAVAFTFSGIASSSAILWEVLLVEGTSSEALVAAYSIPTVIFLVGNLLTPLAGLILERLGLVSGFQILAALALSTFTAKTMVLVFKLEEPKTRLERGDRGGLREAVKLVALERRMLILLLFTVFSSVIYAIFSYQSLYLCDERGAGMNVEVAGLVPSFSSAVSLIILTIVTSKPQINRLGYLITSSLAGVISYTLYTLSPVDPKLAFAAAVASGLRGAEFAVSRAYFVDLLEGSDAVAKGHAISLLYTLGNIVTIPAPTIVGFLYSIQPVNIWYLAISAALGQLLSIVLLTKQR
ncbi:MAG: MFS transporter [Thermofilaceae archaeon]|nr:MFS transporter [Thermofilaceae archaeon]MCX8180927.1 MFS transporter [Thermofilaceae archaeon]MDW8003492.1 MFS transporter [Thermofilaceae archaeon]